MSDFIGNVDTSLEEFLSGICIVDIFTAGNSCIQHTFAIIEARFQFGISQNILFFGSYIVHTCPRGFQTDTLVTKVACDSRQVDGLFLGELADVAWLAFCFTGIQLKQHVFNGMKSQQAVTKVIAYIVRAHLCHLLWVAQHGLH